MDNGIRNSVRGDSTPPRQLERTDTQPDGLIDRFRRNPLVKFIKESARKLGISTSDSNGQQQSQFGMRTSESQLIVNEGGEGEEVESGPPPGLRPPGLELDEEDDYSSALEDEDEVRTPTHMHEPRPNLLMPAAPPQLADPLSYGTFTPPRSSAPNDVSSTDVRVQV